MVGCDGEVLETISQLLLDLVMGEMKEQLERGQYRLTEAQYLQLIGKKTASFLAAACALGTKMAGACGEVVANAKDYGYCLGMVYQLRDDLLDIIGDPAVLGKKTGVDILMGVETLPAIRARSLLPQQYYQVVKNSSGDGGLSSLGDLVTECGALEYTENLIQSYFDRSCCQLGEAAGWGNQRPIGAAPGVRGVEGPMKKRNITKWIAGLWMLIRPVPVAAWAIGAPAIGLAGAVKEIGFGEVKWDLLGPAFLVIIILHGGVSHAANDRADWISGTDRFGGRRLSGGSKVIQRGF